MRVATDQGQIEQLLEAALSMMVGNLTDDQRHAGKVLMNRLELTPEQTVRLLLAHPQMLDQIAENGARQIGSALDTLTSMLGLSKEELEKVIKACPHVLGPSDVVIERINQLGDLLGLEAADRKVELRKALLRFPNLLRLNYEANIVPTFDALQRHTGLPQRDLAKLIVKHPQILSLRLDNILATLGVLSDELGKVRRVTESCSVDAPITPATRPTALPRPPCFLLALTQRSRCGTARACPQPSTADIAELALKLPQILGLSAESNLRPKLRFLRDAFELRPDELHAAVRREPIILGSSLERSLRPNLALWRDALPVGTDLASLVKRDGLRWLSCSAEKRTAPRISRVLAAGLDPHLLMPKMRYTDAQFDGWLVKESIAAQCDTSDPSSPGCEVSTIMPKL